MTSSFYFYDLETTGRDPRWHRVIQFAGVRTDAELELVEDPVSWLVRPDDDVVPEPEALLVTGLAPEDWAAGIDDRELFRRIDGAFSRPRTCVAGFNNLRFDDEFVRYGLWRTLRDPYAREWQGGNSRWDLIDLARMAAALRPDGVVWPEFEGRRSFRLEHLATANGIEQIKAHDAVSDVLATLGLARLLRSAQPRLVDFYLGLRAKRAVMDLVLPPLARPFIHVSGRYPGSSAHLAVVAAVAQHPVNRNAVIVADLGVDPATWMDLDADSIRATLFAPAAELGDRVRPPLKEIHVNRVPAVAPLAVMTPPDADRLQVDVDALQARLEQLRGSRGLSARIADSYKRAPLPGSEDVLAGLYDGFLPDGDRRVLTELRTADAAVLTAPPPLEDPRARALAFEHLARCHPEAMDDVQRTEFAARVRDRLGRGRPGMASLAEACASVDALLAEGRDPRVLEGLRAYLADLDARWQVTAS